MKIKILFGAIFSICIILLVNSITAVEYRTIKEYNDDLIKTQVENINIFLSKLNQILENLEHKTFSIKSKNEIEELSSESSELRNSIIFNPSLPTCFRSILGFIIGIIFSIIGTIIGLIFGPIISLIVRVLTAPVVILAKIIAFIVNILIPW